MTTPLPVLGIDMAKSTFDIHVLTDTAASSHHFVNTPQGFAALAQWLKQSEVSSGSMLAWKPPARTAMRLPLFLYQAGHTVSVVNPAQVVAFRLSEGG